MSASTTPYKLAKASSPPETTLGSLSLCLSTSYFSYFLHMASTRVIISITPLSLSLSLSLWQSLSYSFCGVTFTTTFWDGDSEETWREGRVMVIRDSEVYDNLLYWLFWLLWKAGSWEFFKDIILRLLRANSWFVVIINTLGLDGEYQNWNPRQA